MIPITPRQTDSSRVRECSVDTDPTLPEDCRLPQLRAVRGYPSATLVTLLSVFPFAACGDPPTPSSVERWDSAGTEIVTHRSLVPDASLQVGAEPHLWIEGDERIPPFDRLSAMAMLASGDILVADESASRVHAFSSDGSYLWSAGGSGDGPGEFRAINALFVTSHDSILVSDVSLRRITVLSPTGELVRTHRFAEDVGLPVGLLPDGSLLYRREQRTGEVGIGVQGTTATWSAAGLSDAASRSLTTTPGSASYYGSAGGRNIIVRPDFFRTLVVEPWSGGFAVALSDRPRIDHIGPGGRLLRSVRVPEHALSAEIADPRAVRDSLFSGAPEAMRGPLRDLAEELPIPPRWPPLVELIADDLGRLWVRQYRQDLLQEATWQVFTPDGAYVDEVTTPPRFIPRVIEGGRIVGVWRDELDVESVRVYPVRER